MFSSDAPRTKEQAMRYRYGCWAGMPNGRKYDPNCCAYEMYEAQSHIFYQCGFRPKAGPAKLYCGIHAKKVKP